MGHVVVPRRNPGKPVHRADFELGEHSGRHLRRVLRLHLKAWELLFPADAAELALTELIDNVVQHVPDRRGQTFIFRLPRGEGVRVEVADSGPAVPLPELGGSRFRTARPEPRP